MPKFDKTGPEGKGAQTGRGLGVCEGVKPQGLGRGWRRKGRPGSNFQKTSSQN